MKTNNEQNLSQCCNAKLYNGGLKLYCLKCGSPFIPADREEEYNKRKTIFIARATAQVDTPRIRREAAAIFDRENLSPTKDLNN